MRKIIRLERARLDIPHCCWWPPSLAQMLIFVTKPVHWANTPQVSLKFLCPWCCWWSFMQATRWYSSVTCHGRVPGPLMCQSRAVFLGFCAQLWRAMWVVDSELKMIWFSEGIGGGILSQEFFSIRPRNKWRKTVARVFLLLLCSDRHNPHSLETRHSYGWAEEKTVRFFFLQWNIP